MFFNNFQFKRKLFYLIYFVTTIHSTQASSSSSSSLATIPQEFKNRHVSLAFDYANPKIWPQGNSPLYGLTMGLGYEFNLNDPFSATTLLSFSANTGKNNFPWQQKVSHKLLKLAQTLNYNFSLKETVVQPYAGMGIGAGWWDSTLIASVFDVPNDWGEKGEFLPRDYTEHTTDRGYFWEMFWGINLKLPNGPVPFAKITLRQYSVKKASPYRPLRERGASPYQSYQFGGVNYSAGLAYSF